MTVDVLPPAAARRRMSRLSVLVAAGITDSTGLAFGWTVVLLLVTARDGLGAAAVLSAAMLIGVALSAPVSAVLAARLSPRVVLRLLALGEGSCRLGLFGLLAAGSSATAMAPLVVMMNVLAWSGFAAMRAEAARTEQDVGGGRSLTWYAVAISASEALAAAAASLLLTGHPSTAVLGVTAVLYTGALLPQWLVGAGAPAEPPSLIEVAGQAQRPPLRLLAPACGLGGVTFLLAGAPALLGTVLAFELYGVAGVIVSAVAFAACSLLSARLQAVVGRWRCAPQAAFLLGAVMIGGWALSGTGLVGLAVAQGLSGLAQCTLEGDLDARAVARLGARTTTAGLALASSSRALGGAVSVAALPVLVVHVPLATAALAAAAFLLVACVLSTWQPRRVPVPPAQLAAALAG